MSLELAVQNLTAEIITLRQILQAQATNVQTPVAPATTAYAAPAPAFAAPVAAPVVAAPVFTPPVAQFQPPVAAPAPVAPAAPVPGACPIVDQKSMVEYVMAAYKELGPQKGAAIQGVLNNCQVQSINECRPEHYAYIHQCIEQLKAS